MRKERAKKLRKAALKITNDTDIVLESLGLRFVGNNTVPIYRLYNPYKRALRQLKREWYSRSV